MSSSRRASIGFTRLFATASVRLALTVSAFFGIGGALFVGVVDFGLFRFVEAEVRADLDRQMDVMHADAARLGGGVLVEQLNRDPRNRQARRYLFLVRAPNGRSFSNGLTPAAVRDGGFRHNTATKGRPLRWPDQRPDNLVLSRRAPDGTLLAVARDTQHLAELRGGVRRFALWSGLGVIAIALIAGLAMGYLLLRRMERVNRSVERIVSGDPAERLPAIGLGAEFDDLSRSLNHMLDRQAAMVDALKNVSEGIAHDLRTPLGRLRNRLEELEADSDDPERRRAGIALAVQEIEGITTLFESLLALSRLESVETLASAEPVNAAALIEAVGELYRPSIEDEGGSLRIDAPVPGTAMLQGDATLLAQALSNLVENAIVHADAAPDITLTASGGAEGVRIGVADRGPGIPPGERDKVLRRFYRMDQSRSRPGSGLGLAMCAAVARLHGGTLTLADNRPGLAVTLELPSR